jgi:RNA 2',3'-cyclic 3'-phosphodiesterase
MNTTTTALAFVLPDNHTDSVNTFRDRYDKAAKRWPPHINFLFPFVSPTAFEEVFAALSSASLGGSFSIVFDDFGFFPQKSNVTFHLKLSGASEERFQEIFRAIRETLPHVDVRRPEFKPHLTLGQCPRSEWPAMERELREWLPEGGLKMRCEHLVLLHRSPDSMDRMVAVHTVPL